MAIGRITGSVLKSNLTRNGVDLAFETNLLYLDVTNSRIGIGTSEPTTELDIAGALTTSGVINANGTGNSILVADTLRIAENGSGLRMTNIGAFDNNSGSFRIFSNNDLIFSSGGDSNTALTVDGSTQAINFNNAYTFPTSDGTAGQVLQTDGSGNISFGTISVGDLSIVGSTITSPSDADLTLATAGSGTVVINGLSFPTGDGSANQVLATNGSGQLTFVDSGAADTDSDEAGSGAESTDLGTGSSVINSFNVNTFDSAFYFLVTRDEVNQTLDLRRHSLTHNDTNAFVNTFGQVRSDTSSSYITVDADVDSNLARLTATGQSVSNSVSLYRIVLGQDTSASTDGNTAFIVNADVDSATENLDTWSASTYRGAQYFISATNSTTGESSNMEALVVTDGTSAFITPYGNVNTGNNDLVSLSADVSGGNVRLRATAGAPNTRVAMYRILLGDSESASSGSSVNVIGATTVSSASTTLDSFSSDDYHGAMYLVVGHNSTEGASSVATVYMLNDESDAYVATGPTVSSKGTDQLTFTGSFSGGTATLSCASTSGGSTTVNAYRIHLKRGAANTVTTNTTQTISGTKTFTSAILADTIRSPGSNADILLEPQGTGDVVLNSIRSDDSSAVTIKDNLKVTGLTTTNAFLINAGDGTIGETTTLTVDPASNYLGINQTSPEVTLHMTGEGAQSAQIRMEQHNDSGDAPDVRTRKSRGTAAAPSDNNAGDFLFRINAEAYQTNTYNTLGSIQIDLDGSDATKSTFQIQTHDGSSLATRLQVDGDGDVIITDELTAKSIKDTVNAISAAASVALDPTLGGIQTITLGQDTTFTLSNWASGHRMTLMIDDGANRSVTWPTMLWAGGVEPTLATTGFNTIELWYVGSNLYGAYVGAMS